MFVKFIGEFLVKSEGKLLIYFFRATFTKKGLG